MPTPKMITVSALSLKFVMLIFCIGIMFLNFLPFGVADADAPKTSMLSAFDGSYASEASDAIIRIDGNAELEAFCSIGNGTQEHPFIIENISIDASHANATGIIIKNTDKFLTIRNCSITNGGESHTGIQLDTSENVQIINNTLTHNKIGVYLIYSSCHNVIRGNNCSYNQKSAIYINAQSNQNNVSNNDCSHGGTGIYIANESDRMLLVNNTCTFNRYNGITILLDGWGCHIFDNNCSYNGGNGLLYLDCSSSNTISGNDFSHNSNNGILAWNSNNCVITENTCSYNGGSGIYLDECRRNSITHNVFSFNSDSEMLLADQRVLVGSWFDYSLTTSDDIAIDSYWLNDTIHFQIDSHGKITKIAPLSVGSYGLRIHVMDTNGNEIVGDISLYFDGLNDPFGTSDRRVPGFRLDLLLSYFGLSSVILIMLLKKGRLARTHTPGV